MFLRFEWLKTTPGYTMLNTLKLSDDVSHFLGFVSWEGHDFFVYDSPARREILIRRTDPESTSRLYWRCEQAALVEPGSEVYIGALGLEVAGSVPEPKAIDPEDAGNTQYLGPGERILDRERKGQAKAAPMPAGLRRLDPDGEGPRVEIREPTMVGRSLLAEQWDMPEDALRRLGISSSHVRLTPGGEHWLVEPERGKPVYLEIRESPTIVREGEVLRWTFGDCFGEFRIRVLEE